MALPKPSNVHNWTVLAVYEHPDKEQSCELHDQAQIIHDQAQISFPLQPSEVPEHPWEAIGSDLFQI